MRWDVFISHASEDKDSVARPLADILATHGLFVWFDENEIRLGDSLREKIDLGLAKSRFGVVIISRAFLSKKWTTTELNSLVALEARKRKVVLPVWHGVSRDDVARSSPILADKRAVSTADGLDAVAAAILDAAAWSSQGRAKVHEPFTIGRWSALSSDYFDMNASPASLEVTLGFRQLREEETNIDPQQFAAIAASAWEPTFALLATLMGRRRSDLLIGRTHVRPLRFVDGPPHYIVERTADGVISRVPEWQVAHAVIHLRNWQNERDVDYDAVDFFVAVNRKYTGGYTPTAHSESIRQRLIALKPTITRHLARVLGWSLGEKALNIVLRHPEWKRNSMAVWGGDAYHFSGMITDPAATKKR